MAAKTGIKDAVERAGGVPQLKKILRVSHQIVYVWLERGWVPQTRALQLTRKYKIPLAKLLKPELAKLLTR